MSSFEFFFSFYGLLLALSVAVVAAGFIKAIKTRPKGTLGRLTPLLAVFVLLDIATFWQWAWDSMRELQFSYGLLVVGMVIALIYFAACSFIFPDEDETAWASLDDHYDARKRYVLIGAMASNTIMLGSVLLLTGTSPFQGDRLLGTIFWLLYVATLSVCCLVRNRRVNAVMLSLNVGLYVVIAALTLLRVPPALAGG